MNLTENKQAPALLVIDVQKAFYNDKYWVGNRNNPNAEKIIATLLEFWRKKKFPVFHIHHDSIEEKSILKISLPGGEVMPEAIPNKGEKIIYKNVNSAFIGTNLDLQLRRKGIDTVVIVGLKT